jgi:hypothetical protein
MESDILVSKRFNGFSIKGAILMNHQQNVQSPIVEHKKPMSMPTEPYRSTKKSFLQSAVTLVLRKESRETIIPFS